MSTVYLAAKAGIENVLFVYLNQYVAIEQWIDKNLKDPELVMVFDEGSPVPLIESKAVVASADYLMGAVLIHTVMQIGRIVDHMLKTLIRPRIVGSLGDETWYAPEAVELITGIRLSELYGYPDFVHMNLVRGSIEGLSDKLGLTQAQVLKLAAGLTQFLEEFDAKFHFEQSLIKKGRSNEAPSSVRPVDNPSSVPGKPLPRFMLGPSGFVPRDGNNSYPDAADRGALNPGYPEDEGAPDPTESDHHGEDDSEAAI